MVTVISVKASAATSAPSTSIHWRSRATIWKSAVTSHPSETRVLAAVVLAAAANGGSIPLIIDVTASTANPFLFNAVISGIQVTMFFLLLKGTSRAAFGTSWSCREMLRIGNVWLFWDRTGAASPRAPRKVGEWVRSPIIWGAAGNLTFAWFVMATRYVDTATVAAVFELWVLLSVFLLARLGRLLAVGNQRPHHISPRHTVLASVAFVGVAFVVLSETAQVDVPSQWTAAMFGLGLAFLAALSRSLAVPTSISMGHLTHAHLGRGSPGQVDKYQLTWLSIYGVMWVRSFGAVLNLAIGSVSWWFVGGPLGWSSLFGALLMAVAGVVAVSLVRWALHSSPSLGSQVGHYVAPVVALTLLAVFTDVNVARVDFLLIGAALIVAANVLIRPRPVK